MYRFLHIETFCLIELYFIWQVPIFFNQTKSICKGLDYHFYQFLQTSFNLRLKAIIVFLLKNQL